MVFEPRADSDSEREALRSISEKFGCSAETQVDARKKAGISSDERSRMQELEEEHRALRRDNEIIRKASAYFAQAELDRRPSKKPGMRTQPVFQSEQRPSREGSSGGECLNRFESISPSTSWSRQST